MSDAAPGGDAYLSRLVETALKQEHLAGYSEMLRVVAESVCCDACIVWRVVPGSDFDGDPLEGQLFALTQWFREKEFWTTHDLSPNSATGRAIRARKPDVVNNIYDHPGVNPNDAFFTLTG